MFSEYPYTNSLLACTSIPRTSKVWFGLSLMIGISKVEYGGMMFNSIILVGTIKYDVSAERNRLFAPLCSLRDTHEMLSVALAMRLKSVIIPFHPSVRHDHLARRLEQISSSN